MVGFFKTGDNTEVWGKMSVVGRCKGFYVSQLNFKLGDIGMLSIHNVIDKSEKDESGSAAETSTDFVRLWVDGLRLFVSLVTQLMKWSSRIDGSWLGFSERGVILLEGLSDVTIKYLGQGFFGVFAKECLLTFNKYLDRPQRLELGDYMNFI